MKKLLRFLSLFAAACMLFSIAGFSVYADELEALETLTDETYVDDDDEVPFDGEEETGGEESSEAETGSDKEIDAAAGSFNEGNREVTIPARNIRLKTPQKNKVVLGKTFQIVFKFSPLKSDDYVTYRNFNKNVVRVDENGLVTAIGYGTAKVQIEATSGVKKNIYFTVTDENGNTHADLVKGDAESVDFVDKFAMIRVGKTFQIEPIFYPLGIYDNVTYKSSNSNVASVTSSGLVKGLKAGSATIYVTAASGASAELSITVYDDLLRGIDVSKWQGTINWKKVSSAGVDFVMIRSSYGSHHTDEMLDKNVKGCEKYGIPYGFYHYTYAKSASEARTEAKYFLKTIKGYDPEYPIVLDIEEEYFKKMSRKKVTDIIVAFMEVVEEAGYYAMIYSSPNFINGYVDASRIAKYDIWIACWGDEERLNSYYDGHYGMWQYSATGKVKGIDGDVDMDYSYRDYAAVIKKKGLNRR